MVRNLARASQSYSGLRLTRGITHAHVQLLREALWRGVGCMSLSGGGPHFDGPPLTSFHLTLKTSPHCCRKYPASAPRSETPPTRCLRPPCQCLPARSSDPTRTSAASRTPRAPAPAVTRGTPPAV